MLIGTEQLGVLSSDDNGEHFQDANGGFFHRQILALALDAEHPGRILAVLAHAPESIVATDDDGKSWLPLGPGLRTEQMLRVYASPDGWWASIEHGGLMRYDAQKKSWQRAGIRDRRVAAPSRIRRREARAPSCHRGQNTAPRQLQQIVNDMAFSSNRWFAATDAGLLMSTDRGATWSLKPLGPLTTLPVQSVRVSPDGQQLWVVSLRGLVFSTDGGTTWAWHDLPLKAGGAMTLDVDREDEATMISIAHNGLYISRDAGNTWQQAASGSAFDPRTGSGRRGKRFPGLHAHRGAVCFLGLRPHLDSCRGHARRWLFSGRDHEERCRSHLCCLRNGWPVRGGMGTASPQPASSPASLRTSFLAQI